MGSGEQDGEPSWKITSQLCYPSTPSSPLRDTSHTHTPPASSTVAAAAPAQQTTAPAQPTIGGQPNTGQPPSNLSSNGQPQGARVKVHVHRHRHHHADGSVVVEEKVANEKESDAPHRSSDDLQNVAGLRTSAALDQGAKIHLSSNKLTPPSSDQVPESTTADSKLRVSANACPQCGVLIKPNLSFCNSCGHASFLAAGADMNGHADRYREHSSGRHQTHANPQSARDLQMSPLSHTDATQKSLAPHTIAGAMFFFLDVRIAGGRTTRSIFQELAYWLMAVFAGPTYRPSKARNIHAHDSAARERNTWGLGIQIQQYGSLWIISHLTKGGDAERKGLQPVLNFIARQCCIGLLPRRRTCLIHVAGGVVDDTVKCVLRHVILHVCFECLRVTYWSPSIPFDAITRLGF